ncbi:MAG: hypothetical protein HC857_12690 [Synechococcales cyanobacterium RU_4_20]|nr:hypothetical protein [Synechococcales cyanobacterium RU_4_20]
MRQLGQRHQVLCVTHQPLIAAVADHHFCVRKEVLRERSHRRPRRAPDRPRAAATGAGGIGRGKIGSRAIAFADSLLDQAAQARELGMVTPQTEPSRQRMGKVAIAKKTAHEKTLP